MIWYQYPLPSWLSVSLIKATSDHNCTHFLIILPTSGYILPTNGYLLVKVPILPPNGWLGTITEGTPVTWEPPYSILMYGLGWLVVGIIAYENSCVLTMIATKNKRHHRRLLFRICQYHCWLLSLLVIDSNRFCYTQMFVRYCWWHSLPFFTAIRKQ